MRSKCNIINIKIDDITVTATPECFRHDDCRNSEVCHTGSCINACIVKECVENAICSTTVHDIACLCRPGYTGNGHVECSLCKYRYIV